MGGITSDRLINLFSNAYPGLIAYIDRDLRYRFISSEFFRWFGGDLTEIMGGKIDEVRGKEVFAGCIPYIKKTLEGNVVVFESKVTNEKLQDRFIKHHYYPDKDKNGNVIGMLAFVYDFTNQKLAEKKVAEEKESRFFSILMQAPIVFCLMEGPEHIYELINPLGRSYFGGKDFTGMKVKDAVPEMESQGILKVLDQIYEKGESVLFPNQLIKLKQPDGSFKEYFFDLYYEPLKDKDGFTTGILNIAVDVTDKVLSTQNLERAVKLRDEFISIASHELRTPLTSLKLLSQLILRTLDKGKSITVERQRDNAIQTSELVSHLSRLIDHMLDVSKIRTGKLMLEKSQVDLEQVVRSVVAHMKMQFEEAGVGVPSIKVQEKVEGFWDRIRLEQVMENLLTNALRYGEGKNIIIQIKKTYSTAKVCVCDFGQGIAKEDQARIFERFERAISPSEVSGMGLGLFIVREIVEAHGGSVKVESELGKGSTFIVELPLG